MRVAAVHGHAVTQGHVLRAGREKKDIKCIQRSDTSSETRYYTFIPAITNVTSTYNDAGNTARDKTLNPSTSP